MKTKGRLTAAEAADILQIPLVKILRWAHEGKIPCRLAEDGPSFLDSEIRDWARERRLPLRPRSARPAGARAARRPLSLARAVENGGVTFGLEGGDLFEVIRNAVHGLPFSEERKTAVLEELLDREAAASTGIGRGVAIPHPRHILELELREPVVPVFFLRTPVDFNAVDGEPVRVLFMMFSPSTAVHLQLLSCLSYCLREPAFLPALTGIATAAGLIRLLEETQPRPAC